MTSTEVVRVILYVEAVALALALVILFGYAVWSRAAHARSQRRRSAARAIIATHLETKRLPASRMADLSTIPTSDLHRLFFEVAPSVGEVERAWLRQIAAQLGVLPVALTDLESGAWHTRLLAARLLTLLDAEPAIMHPLLRDQDENVRAQAATYVAQHPTDEGILALIRMLGNESQLCRFAAKDALMRLGSAAMPVIVSRLRNPADPETTALLEVACATASHDYMPAAVVHHGHESPEVRLLVARLLRGIGGPAAGDQLMRLATDPSPKVREVALEALGYLNHWVASGPVAKLLDDPVSRVRLSAALALDRLGPTGELLLRRARSKGSEQAAAAASRILDDPSRVAPAIGASR
jgi:HEAT repeat protein